MILLVKNVNKTVNKPKERETMEKLTVQCRGCGKVFILGEDSVVVTSRGTIQSFVFYTDFGGRSSMMESTPDHPDLVALLENPPYNDRLIENAHEVNIIVNDLALGMRRYFQCFHCKKIQQYKIS